MAMVTRLVARTGRAFMQQLIRPSSISLRSSFSSSNVSQATSEDKIITKEDVYNLAFGFGISASGGGGAFMQGLEIVNNIVKDGFDQISIYKPTDLKPGKKAFVSGGLGKPESLTDPIAFGVKVEQLLRGLDLFLKEYQNSSLQGILPIEAGPLNGLLPVYSVFKMGKDYWLFDADGAGRAVPAMTNLMYDFFPKGTTPIAYNFLNDAGQTKNVILQNLDADNIINGSDAEQVFSSVMLYQADDDLNDSIPLACWEFDGKMAAGFPKAGAQFPQGTYTYWKGMGKQFKECYDADDRDTFVDFLTTLNAQNSHSSQLYDQLIFPSTINDLKEVPNDRWNCGYIIFDRKVDVTGAPKSEKRLYYVNENLTVSEYDYQTKAITNLATSPSSITTFFYDEEPDKDVVIDSYGNTLNGGYIPYNTGDMQKIRELCDPEKRTKIIVAVTDPTIPENPNYLFHDEMKDRFLDVMNSTFAELNSLDGESDEGNIFPGTIDEVVPRPDLIY